jgi:hypothetical protein
LTRQTAVLNKTALRTRVSVITMLAPASESLLVRFLYSLAVFASDTVMENLGIAPDLWNTLVLLVVFVMCRTLFTLVLDRWHTHTPLHALLKDITQTFVDANWTTLLFIIVQWAINLFKGFWRLSASPIIGVVSMEIPLLILTALIYASYDSPLELTSANKVADNILASINFAIAFFVADMLVLTMQMAPSEWDLLWLMTAFGVLNATVNKAFDAWRTGPGHSGAAALKLIVVDNAKTILSIGVFILTKLFVGIFNAWWVEGEHWIVAAVIFQVFLLVILAVVNYFHEHVDNKKNVPDAMINRSLFAMTMFIAEKARALNTAVFVEFELLVMAAAFVALHAATTVAMSYWRIEAGPRGAGERILKNTIQKNAFTWVTITVVFIVRLFVDIYKMWWRDEPTAIIGAVLVETTAFLLIAVVKTLLYYETENVFGKK